MGRLVTAVSGQRFQSELGSPRVLSLSYWIADSAIAGSTEPAKVAASQATMRPHNSGSPSGSGLLSAAGGDTPPA